MRNLFVTGRKTAPGELMLKIIGMVLLLLGVMMAFGGIGAISLVTKGSSNDSVVAYLQENHMTYGQMLGGTVISCVSGIVYIISGALGVLNGGNIYKADQCLVMVVIMVAEVLGESCFNWYVGQFQPIGVVNMLILPALYLVGALRNKSAVKQC